MAEIDSKDAALIEAVKSAGGDPHQVACIVCALVGSIECNMDLVPVYRRLAQWYANRCNIARARPWAKRRPTRNEIDRKFKELVAAHSQSAAN